MNGAHHTAIYDIYAEKCESRTITAGDFRYVCKKSHFHACAVPLPMQGPVCSNLTVEPCVRNGTVRHGTARGMRRSDEISKLRRPNPAAMVEYANRGGGRFPQFHPRAPRRTRVGRQRGPPFRLRVLGPCDRTSADRRPIDYY